MTGAAHTANSADARDERVRARAALIVDDHAGFRHLARLLLETAGWRVVGEADSVSTAVAAAAELRPDVILLDFGLPDGSGLDVTRILAREPGSPLVVLVSSRPAEDIDPDVLSAAGGRFIAKSDLSPATLRRVIGWS